MRRLFVKKSVERLASITSRKLSDSGSQIFWPFSAATRAASGKRTASSIRFSAVDSITPTGRARPPASAPPT